MSSSLSVSCSRLSQSISLAHSAVALEAAALGLGHVVALFDYEAQSSDELSLAVGDVVVVLDKPDEGGWWVGALGDRTGLDADEFPLTNAGFIDVVLFICQLAPCVMALGLLVAAMSGRAASSRGQRKFYASLPAIVRQEPPAAPRSRGLLARAKRLVPTKRLVVTAERPTPTGAREITHVNTGVLRTPEGAT